MSTTKPGEEKVDEQARDKLFASIKNINDNNICIDCEKKNPKWASIHLGVYLCLDCAGRHRQYGVIYSFIKSINLDAWNRKQLLFMEKGGNSRALEYFKKRGVITPQNKNIDYKSPIVQQYKTLLTQEVDMELGGVKMKPVEEKKAVKVTNTLEGEGKVQEKKIEIPTAEEVQQVGEKPKKKKEKKKIGAKQIVIEDFQNLAFDNGVPTEQKDKIVKQYEKKKDIFDQPETSTTNFEVNSEPQVPKIEQPKELSEQDAKKKIEELKQKANLKTISSQEFKDNTVDNIALKQNLNKFSTSSSISSSAFFDKPEQQGSGQIVEGLKDFVSNAGQKWLSKIPGLSGYFNK